MTLLDRLLGRPEPHPAAGGTASPIKATTGDGWLAAYQQGGINLTSLQADPQAKAARLLQAYKVGWFNKAERKISTDFAGLEVSLAPEDAEGDNETAEVEADLTVPWDTLDPIGQFLRLMERPNPFQTGRQLRQKTMIRVDMAGWAFWYTELGTDRLVVEDGIYGISPARLWPSFDKAGKLIGYVLDKNRDGGGVPFDVDEIIPFSYPTSEDDLVYGVGVVEAVWSQVGLTDAMARHTADVLSTGGRLAGAMWPKNRALDEAEFQDAQRAWRNVASDPNAARRLLIFPEPMEWAAGSSTPAEIGIPELATLNRDDILTAFPISPYQLGVPMPGGLNSAETRKEDRRDYWEGTIHPRVELFEEAIQSHLVPRYEKVVGYTLDFEVDEPNLDDALHLTEKAAALDDLISAGFDEKEAVAAVGLDHIKYLGKPEPPPMLAPFTEPEPDVAEPPPVPPKPPAKSVRTEAEHTLEPSVERAHDRLTRFFTDQRLRVERAWRALPPTKAARMKATPDWWDADAEDRLLAETMRGIYVEVGRDGLQAVADTLGRVVVKPFTQAVYADLVTYGGQRIKDINERTLQSLTIQLAEGTRRGYSINQLIDGVPDEGYTGLTGVTLDNGTPAFSADRAEVIARTETQLSYNRSTVTGYEQYGVTTLLAYDGDDDPECAERNGHEFSIEEAAGIEDHPNGTLVWSPVVDKAIHEVDHYTVDAIKEVSENYTRNLAALGDAFAKAVTGQPAPITNVYPADVRVAPTEVNVEPSRPAMRLAIERDDNGKIVAISEHPA